MDDFARFINDCGFANTRLCRYRLSRFSVPLTAVAYHLLIAAMLLTPHDFRGSTNAGILLKVIPSQLGIAAYLVVACLCTLASFLLPRLGWRSRLLLALPQQTALTIVAIGTVWITVTGLYPSGYTAPSEQVIIGQSLAIFFAGLHTIAIWQAVR